MKSLTLALAFLLPQTARGTEQPLDERCQAVSACVEAFTRYSGVIKESRSFAQEQDLSGILARFNQVSANVHVKGASATSEPMTSSQFFEAYRYRQRQMAPAVAWNGIADLYATELNTYRAGLQKARQLNEQAVTASAGNPKALRKALEKRMEVEEYFPGAMGKDKMRTMDFIYVYLGNNTEPALLSAAGREAEAAQVAHEQHLRAEAQEERAAAQIRVETEAARIQTALEAAIGVELALRPLALPSVLAVEASALAPVLRPVKKNVVVNRPVVPAGITPVDLSKQVGKLQVSGVSGRPFSLHGAGGRFIVKDEKSADRATIEQNAKTGSTVVKWGGGGSLFTFYHGLTTIPGHELEDTDLYAAEKIELLPGGTVRSWRKSGAAVVEHCQDLLTGRYLPSEGCQRPVTAIGETVSIPQRWGTEIKTTRGNLREIQWVPKSDGGGAYARVLQGEGGLKEFLASPDQPAHYIIPAKTRFEMKSKGQAPGIYVALQEFSIAKRTPTSPLSLEAMREFVRVETPAGRMHVSAH